MGAIRRMVPRRRSNWFGRGMLKEIDFSGCGVGVDDHGMAAVAEHHRLLEIVSVARTDIGDMAMESMGIFCPKLQLLNVSHTRVTSQGIQLLLEGIAKIE